MPQTTPKTQSATALQRTCARLSQWQARVIAARNRCEQLNEQHKRAVQPFLQELKDRCDHAENKVLQLLQAEAACELDRTSVRHAAVRQSFRELANAWLPVERTLQAKPIAQTGEANRW